MAIEKILNKRSNAVVTEEGVDTPKKPTSSQLDNGEIAVNYHKGTERLFMKNDNDEVVEFVPKNEVENHFAKMMPYGRNSGTLVMESSYEETVIGANSIEFYEDTNTEGTLAGSLRGNNSHLEVKHGDTDDPHQWKRIATIDDIPSVTPQVQSDWNETDTTSKAYILNKPTIPTKTSELTNDSDFTTNAYVEEYAEPKLNFTTTTQTSSINASKNTYYYFTNNLNSLVIYLPNVNNIKPGDSCGFSFTASSSFSSFDILPASGTTTPVKKMKDFTITGGKPHEVVALYDSNKWLVTVTEFE